MSDPAVIGAAIVLVLSSIGGTVVLIINALSTSRDRREAAAERLQQLTISIASAKTADDTAKKADVLIEGNAKIHELTNSTNSRLQQALELKTQELASVRELMAQMEKTAKEIASTRAVTDLQQTAAALRTPVATADPTAGVQAAATTVLKSIDTNTAAIDENTKKTEAKVDALKDQR